VPEVLHQDLLQQKSDIAETGEESLVLAAQKGDGGAAELIVNRYKSFVKLRSKSYFLVGADREDVIQEGMIGLYKAIRDFKPERKVSFKTFAELCITRHIISAVKTATRQKHMPLNSYVSLSKQDGGVYYYEHIGYAGEQESVDPEQIVIEKENVIGIEGEIDKLLSEFEAKVLMHHLNGLSYGKIAACLHKDPKSIDNALQRIKRKLEKFLLSKKALG